MFWKFLLLVGRLGCTAQVHGGGPAAHLMVVRKWRDPGRSQGGLRDLRPRAELHWQHPLTMGSLPPLGHAQRFVVFKSPCSSFGWWDSHCMEVFDSTPLRPYCSYTILAKMDLKRWEVKTCIWFWCPSCVPLPEPQRLGSWIWAVLPAGPCLKPHDERHPWYHMCNTLGTRLHSCTGNLKLLESWYPVLDWQEMGAMVKCLTVAPSVTYPHAGFFHPLFTPPAWHSCLLDHF